MQVKDVFFRRFNVTVQRALQESKHKNYSVDSTYPWTGAVDFLASYLCRGEPLNCLDGVCLTGIALIFTGNIVIIIFHLILLLILAGNTHVWMDIIINDWRL